MRKEYNQYYISYECDENGGYIASVPAIRGCVVYGKTLAEAHRNIQSAIVDCLEVISETHQSLPKETIKPEIARKLSFVKVPAYAQT